MKLSDLLALSFENLRRRMGRTALTVIGVVVGTCSIVVMVSLGIAMNSGFEEMLQQWGDLTQIQVYNWGGSGDGSSGSTAALTDEVVAKMDEIDHVVVATPLYTPRYLNMQITAGKNGRYVMGSANVVGMYPKAIEALEYELVSGQYLPEKAAAMNPTGKKKVQVLIGEKAGYAFTDSKKRGDKAQRYDGQTDAAGNPVAPFVDVTKDKMLLKSVGGDNTKNVEYTLDVLGVMKEDYKKGYVTSAGIVMDLDVLKKMEKDYMKANNIKADTSTQSSGYDTVVIKVDDVKNVADVETAVKAFGYETYSMSSERENMQKQSQMIQLVLGGLGAVSLFVAALSIANTMTMAIYERTREIGVMKVLGCPLGKIREMFLFEAAMIGFLGGVLGVVLSYILSLCLNVFGPALMNSGLGGFLPMYGSKMSVIPPWLALVGISFSTLIGVLSGIMPANRAVRISALEAIRHE